MVVARKSIFITLGDQEFAKGILPDICNMATRENDLVIRDKDSITVTTDDPGAFVNRYFEEGYTTFLVISEATDARNTD